MRVGVIARAENRGLGHLTWEAARALEPDRVLVVTVGARDRGFETHVERFPGATFVEWRANGLLPAAPVRAWLDGLDVVYAAETPYDPRLPAWCETAGVRLVLHVMPEFFRDEWADESCELWNPTDWRHELLPARARVVPVPVPLDRWPTPAPLCDGPARFVHVAGNRAAGDRNGSILVTRALGLVQTPVHLRIFTQGASFPAVRTPRHVQLEVVRGGVDDYWRLYDDADVLVMPRRYGGLSLPVNEAAGAGLAVVLSDVVPNRSWPATFVPARPRSQIRAPGGSVQSYEADPKRLAFALDSLNENVELRHRQQEAAREWADSHSWANLRPLYRELFAG